MKHLELLHLGHPQGVEKTGQQRLVSCSTETRSPHSLILYSSDIFTATLKTALKLDKGQRKELIIFQIIFVKRDTFWSPSFSERVYISQALILWLTSAGICFIPLTHELDLWRLTRGSLTIRCYEWFPQTSPASQVSPCPAMNRKQNQKREGRWHSGHVHSPMWVFRKPHVEVS